MGVLCVIVLWQGGALSLQQMWRLSLIDRSIGEVDHLLGLVGATATAVPLPLLCHCHCAALLPLRCSPATRWGLIVLCAAAHTECEAREGVEVV